jgi:catechol 2,3-dioxygenase-like lactoylglutathione lyase family enzyme
VAIARYLVENLDAAVQFYTEKLGFDAGRAFGPVALAHWGDLELWLSGAGSSGRNQVGAAPGGWNRIVLEVPDLGRRTAGLTLRGDRVDGPAGSWQLVDDPWGNPIELFQRK